MSAAAAFNVLYALLIEWVTTSGEVDVARLDSWLDGWDPEAEKRALATVERRLRGAVG